MTLSEDLAKKIVKQREEIASLKQQLSAEKQIHETTEQYWVDKYNSLVSKIKQFDRGFMEDYSISTIIKEEFKKRFAEELSASQSWRVGVEPSKDGSAVKKVKKP